MKATDPPSGEKAGQMSSSPALAGSVSRRLSPESIETRKMERVPSEEAASENAIKRAFGLQDKPLPLALVIFRSGPPVAGMARISPFRTKAIVRPSGDQAGYSSGAES